MGQGRNGLGSSHTGLASEKHLCIRENVTSRSKGFRQPSMIRDEKHFIHSPAQGVTHVTALVPTSVWNS